MRRKSNSAPGDSEEREDERCVRLHGNDTVETGNVGELRVWACVCRPAVSPKEYAVGKDFLLPLDTALTRLLRKLQCAISCGSCLFSSLRYGSYLFRRGL